MAKSASILRWERIRARGVLRYVFLNGLLSYGLPLFLLMTFVVHRAHLTVAFVIASALLWLLGGALFGWLMWHLRGRMYQRLAQLLGAQGPD